VGADHLDVESREIRGDVDRPDTRHCARCRNIDRVDPATRYRAAHERNVQHFR
jgi:hypothetical protein